MRKEHCWIAAIALLWLSSCCALPEPRVPEAVVKTEWIGEMRSQSDECPTKELASGWTLRPLFPTAGRGEKLERAARQAGLSRFCVAEYEGKDKDPRLPRRFRMRLRRAEPDSIAITPAGPPLRAMTADPFFQRFTRQVQRPHRLLFDPAAPQRVRLTFLDTQPDGVGVPVRPIGGDSDQFESEHGFSLMQMAGFLEGLEPPDPSVGGAKGGERITAGPLQIASRLALPRPRSETAPGDPSPVGSQAPKDPRRTGGSVGTFRDLGQAIWDEVAVWLAEPDSPTRPERLLLNLSLGWDGEKFGGLDGSPTMPTVVAPIYEALKFAAENEVLVIAAAGNERPGPEPTHRPLLPAGWQDSGPWYELMGPERPLVYAVSGVDGRKLPLVNTRARGEAPLVAYGDHVVVPDIADGTVHTGTLTGTSVSTAVVSTIAALVWSQSTGLTPNEVMAKLRDSGESLDRTPDFAAGGDLNVRLVTLCAALAGVCPSCTVYCPVRPTTPVRIEDVLQAFKPDHEMSGSLFSELVPEEDHCSVSPIYYDPAQPPQTPCPSDSLPNLADQPWVRTQPDVDPCPDCTATRIGGGGSGGGRNSSQALPGLPSTPGMLSALPETLITEGPESGPTFKLRVAIPAEFQSYDLQGATLQIYRVNGSGDKIPVGGCSIGGSLPEGMSLEMSDLCFNMLPIPFQASLTFTLAPHDAPEGSGIFSIQSPVFVEE